MTLTKHLRKTQRTTEQRIYYHGSLDSKGRKHAIDRFKKDAECRILLATDSGGVGLNLQEGSAVIIMDQPWNPAVLEQRVGRVHRLGQQRPVNVYHFISQGTIEHGMMNVLRFKSAVFAGVLDGGATDVFMDKGKANKFMETVADVVGSTPDRMPSHEQPSPAADTEASPGEEPLAEPAPPAPAAPDPWRDVVTAGLDLFGKIAQALQPDKTAAPTAGLRPPPGLSGIAAVAEALMAKSDKTGVPELRIPLPDPETVNRLAEALGGLATLLRSQRK